MDHILVYITAFFIILLSALLLFNKVHYRFRKFVIVYTFLFFIVFCMSLLLSQDIRHSLENLAVRANADLPRAPLLADDHMSKRSQLIKKNGFKKEEMIVDAPLISQLPELPRGCEVTSLAMLLQYADINVGKMELAEQIKRDPTPYKVENGQVFFGHPNTGFVGDMYNIDNPGYGVYYKPIMELAEEFLPNRIINLTGKEFSELETSVSNGIPVWIITNTWYSQLPPEQFQTWNTPVGEVEITYREHSVLITGYDNDYVYFNDPLMGEKDKRAPKQDFIDAWVQMGRQAITFK